MHIRTRHLAYWTIGALIAAACYMLSAVPVHAQTLEVAFEHSPLFSETNLVPGSSVMRFVEVGNHGTTTENVYMRANNAFSDGLADGVVLTVTNGSTYFDDTFATFFGAGEVSLGAISAGATTTYFFTASFPNAAGNAYQNKTMGFDLIVGFEGGESESDAEPDDDGGEGGGGGGSSTFRIFNESVDDVDDGAGSAILSWNTSRESTTRLVCGNADDGPFALDPNASSFGYTFTTAEDMSMTEDHEVTLTGLSPGTYYCRPASREDTDDDFTVGDELTFTLNAPSEPFVLPTFTPFAPGIGGAFPAGQIAGAAADDGPAGATSSTSTESTGNQITSGGPEGQVASAFTGGNALFDMFSGAYDCAISFLLILLAIFYGWSVLHDGLFMHGDALARRFFIRNSIFTGLFLLVMYLLVQMGMLGSLWLAGVALLFAWVGFDYRRHARNLVLWSPLPRLRFYALALLLALVTVFFFDIACLLIPLLATLIGSIIWLVIIERRDGWME